MKKTILYILTAVFAVSCVYPFDPEINVEADRMVVVDGSIVIGGTSTVSLSYVTNLDKTKETILKPKADAWIEDSNGNRFNSGTSIISDKVSIPTTTLKPGLQYRAGVKVDGDTYYSDWVESEPAPEINSIEFTSDGNLVYVWADVKVPDSRSGYVGFSFEECWEFHAEYYPDYLVNTDNWVVYPIQFPWPYYWCYKYDQSRQNVLWDYSALQIEDVYSFKVHTFPCTDNRNHKKYSILLKAFALSKDAYVFNKKTQEMSELGGDLFSPDPGMLKGNVHCENDPEKQVYGYVMACEAASKRAFLTSIYQKPVAPSDAFLISVATEDMSHYYYDLNYRPVKDVQSEDGSFIGWAPSRCINCVDAGGTQTEPDFWDEKQSPVVN